MANDQYLADKIIESGEESGEELSDDIVRTCYTLFLATWPSSPLQALLSGDPRHHSSPVAAGRLTGRHRTGPPDGRVQSRDLAC